MASDSEVGDFIGRLRGTVTTTFDPPLDPRGGRHTVDDGCEYSKKPLSGNLRVPLLPLPAAPPVSSVSEPFPHAASGEPRDCHSIIAWPASSRRPGFRVRVEFDPDGGDESPLDAGEPPVGRGKTGDDGGGLDAFHQAEKGTDGLGRVDLGKGAGGDDDDGDDFLSACETISVSSCCSDSFSGFGNCTSNRTGIHDADEVNSAYFASDGSLASSPSLRMKSEAELHDLRHSVTEEIERRETAEMALLKVQNQWKRLAAELRQVGVSFPAVLQDGEVPLELYPAQICQEILFTKSVSEAIARSVSQKEAASDIEAIIDLKNREISRVLRRLHFHEVMNHEMSRRNVEIAFSARQQRARRLRRRWTWACIGLSVTLGASWLASFYLDYSFEDLRALFCHDTPTETDRT
ncbi:hypothetical protein Cni_G11941 [Canna indica]|uniref:Uncharacterized protein n=1 Tax=Canna indica TaxID=4628 RepID=A0AAQ3KCM2_9LILI|nr:hypothetical protein Cni_G11941 [Canna indica]